MMTTDLIQYISTPIEVSMGDDWFDIAGEDNFWMQWRFREMKRILKNQNIEEQKILEIGCGRGIVINQCLKHLNLKVDGCDLNEFALGKIKDVDSNIYCYNIFDKKKEMLNKYTGIFLLDVIEHIEDDVTFLKASTDHIDKGGLVLVNVPAHMHLFSAYDTAVGHYRRYTKKTLSKSFEDAGIEVVKMNYWAGGLYPIAILRKFYIAMQDEKDIITKGLKPPNVFLDKALKMMGSAESSLPFNVPIGASLIALGRKK